MSIKENMGEKTPKGERQQITFEEFLRAVLSDIDPAKYAGEGWFATEEYARPEDIRNPWTRGEVMREGDYYPGPDLMRKMRNY